MSSHCNRYPGCGCNSYAGSKCYLPEGDVRLLEKEAVHNSYAWEEFKQEEEKRNRDFKIKGRFKKVRRKVTNIAPKKKKRKK